MLMGNDSKRETGRTTRMLEVAAQLCRAGKVKRVIVYGSTVAESQRLLSAFVGPVEASGEPVQRLYGRVVVYRGVEVFFLEIPPTFDWYQLRCPGESPGVEAAVLVDHHAIEVRFAKMLNELARYDQGAPR